MTPYETGYLRQILESTERLLDGAEERARDIAQSDSHYPALCGIQGVALGEVVRSIKGLLSLAEQGATGAPAPGQAQYIGQAAGFGDCAVCERHLFGGLDTTVGRVCIDCEESVLGTNPTTIGG